MILCETVTMQVNAPTNIELHPQLFIHIQCGLPKTCLIFLRFDSTGGQSRHCLPEILYCILELAAKNQHQVELITCSADER